MDVREIREGIHLKQSPDLPKLVGKRRGRRRGRGGGRGRGSGGRLRPGRRERASSIHSGRPQHFPPVREI